MNFQLVRTHPQPPLKRGLYNLHFQYDGCYIDKKISLLMKNSLEIFYAIIALLLVIITGWGIFLFSKLFLEIFSQLEKEVAASIIAAVSTVLISVLSVILSKNYERRREIRKEQREKKIPVYEELIGFLLKLLLAEKAGKKPPTEKEMAKFFMDFTERLIVWGADDVLKSFQVFREDLVISADMPETDHKQTMINLENLMLKVREDLGHKNSNLEKGDVLSLFINDIRTVLN